MLHTNLSTRTVRRHTSASVYTLDISIARVSYENKEAIQLHLLRTDHMTPNELVDVVEIAGFGYGAVVIAVRQFFPHDDLGLAQPEQLLHVTWSERVLMKVFLKEWKKQNTYGTISS
jgi:hypothetical protein